MGDMADWILEQDDPIEDRLKEPIYIPYIDIVTETEKAWLFKMEDGRNKWLPKSQCTLDDDEKEVLVPPWLQEHLNRK